MRNKNPCKRVSQTNNEKQLLIDNYRGSIRKKVQSEREKQNC